ncbi:MAG: hypothetical protein JWQ21_1900 [Herminiimonas sp.]|nr:hypothetical protein [Herminiimonas sp.]
MQKTMQKTATFQDEQRGAFNFNKLQAVLCITASAATSIALIVWAVKTFF